MTTNATLRHWWQLVLRYKLLHVLFWAYCYLSLVHELSIFIPGQPVVWLDAVFCPLAELVSIYLTLYLLLPRFFYRQRYLLFGLLALSAILVSCFLSVLLKNWVDRSLLGRSPGPALIVTFTFVIDSLVKTTIFFSIVVVSNRVGHILKMRRLEHERMKAELDFLKAQINPHFLLNTINNIYVLIEEDRKTAGTMLIRFSELLRYQLYECNDGRNPIATEMEFIRSFVAIEQLRLGNTVQVALEGTDTLPFFEIEPFVLLPFVENAFKYISRRSDGNNHLSISAALEGGKFYFSVTNTCDDNVAVAALPKPGGIGVSNVQRRLDLLYPGKHTLELQKHNNIHTAKLTIHV